VAACVVLLGSLMLFFVAGAVGAGAAGGGTCSFAVANIGPTPTDGPGDFYGYYNITGGCTGLDIAADSAGYIAGQFFAGGYFYDWGMVMPTGTYVPDSWDTGSGYIDAEVFACGGVTNCDQQSVGTGPAGSAVDATTYTHTRFGSACTSSSLDFVYDGPPGGGAGGNCVSADQSVTSLFGVEVLPIDGTAGQCSVVSEAGFYSGTATGTSTYSFTLGFSGETQIIAADPEDGSLPTITNHGLSFSENTDFESSSNPLAFSPLSSTVILTTEPAAGTDPNAVHFYCYDAGQWYDWGTVSDGGSGVAPAPPPCSGISFQSEGVVSSEQTIGITFTPSSNTGPFLLDPNNGGTATEAILGGGATLWEPDVDWKLIEPGAADSSLVLSVTQTADATTAPTLWCYNELTSAWVNEGDTSSGVIFGTTQGTGPGGSGGTAGDGGCFDLGEHLATSGMDLYNPISWVTGGVKDMGYVIEWTFVPCTSAVTSLENEFGVGTSAVCSGTSKASMSQLFGCMAGGVVVAPAADVAAIQTHADTGSCSDLSGSSTALTVAGSSLNACDLLAATSSSHFSSGATSAMSTVQIIETVSVYIFAALGLVFFIRSTLSGRDS
jgi:hypothetical protein